MIEIRGFPSPSLNEFGFIQEYVWFCTPPSGINLREATVGHFEIGPLHDFLEKGQS
jgi:hypothetical protein